MPLSVTELISLLRRGREAMLQVALDEQRAAPAVVVARALLSVAPATLHACLLDGEPPQFAVVDSAGQPLPVLPKASSRSVDTGPCQSVFRLC